MALSDSPIIQRIAALRIEQKSQKLDQVQQNELDLCLDWLVNFLYKQALLKNFSLMASMTDDFDWQHAICADLDD
ncbi:DUF7667 family protein [Paenibacillus oryzisoli]|uniref:IDEAL domain-containing protein n=1 Tax=Paenibacillus oryzisoli TaxID=1850517 RepID=A0A198AI31_9BACL|nr:hypothetical protein [Paenibacillus oryzisoli]OAS21164.1 hypothetical protein A8708_30215 [Paenibacillus oryzisoli]